jgi:hypothetical protein
MGGTMQSFDIAAKKTKARPHRRKYDDCLRAIFFPELDARLGNSGLPPRVFSEHSGTHASTGVKMRHVKIVQQLEKTYPCAAIDQQTGGVVLRRHDVVALIALCRRLGWNMDDAERAKSVADGPAEGYERSYDANSSNNAFASFKSRVSNPSVNHP